VERIAGSVQGASIGERNDPTVEHRLERTMAMKVKPVSVQLYSVRDEAAKDFVGTLKRIAAMGYVGVEYAGLHGMAAKDVAKVVKDLGMVSSSAHVGLATKDSIAQLADDAKTLGYKYLITGFGPDDMKTQDGVKACIDKFAAASELVKAEGLTLGMHNHWWEFTNQFGGQMAYDMIMDAVPGMVSELDIFWTCFGKADATKVLGKWGKRVPLLHVKDGNLAEPIEFCAAGQGKVPVKQIIDSADDATVEWLVVELDECKTDMMTAVGASIDFLVKSGLGKKR
jgi:sugar phosphate isomerase/epimerase